MKSRWAERTVALMTEDERCLRSVLLLCGKEGPLIPEPIIKSICSVFRFSNASHKLLRYVLWFECAVKTADATTLLRDNNLANKLVVNIGCHSFAPILERLKPVVASLLSVKPDLEVMATRIAMRPSRDSPDDRKKKATKLAQRNCSTLREWTGRCLDSVLDAPVPPDFTEWVRMVFHAVVKSRVPPGSQLSFLSSFVFCRLVCPEIVLASRNMSKQMKRNLILVTKVLQKVANGVSFDAKKENSFYPLNSWANEAIAEIQRYMFRVIDHARVPLPNFPGKSNVRRRTSIPPPPPPRRRSLVLTSELSPSQTIYPPPPPRVRRRNRFETLATTRSVSASPPPPPPIRGSFHSVATSVVSNASMLSLRPRMPRVAREKKLTKTKKQEKKNKISGFDDTYRQGKRSHPSHRRSSSQPSIGSISKIQDWWSTSNESIPPLPPTPPQKRRDISIKPLNRVVLVNNSLASSPASSHSSRVHAYSVQSIEFGKTVRKMSLMSHLTEGTAKSSFPLPPPPLPPPGPPPPLSNSRQNSICAAPPPPTKNSSAPPRPRSSSQRPVMKLEGSQSTTPSPPKVHARSRAITGQTIQDAIKQSVSLPRSDRKLQPRPPKSTPPKSDTMNTSVVGAAALKRWEGWTSKVSPAIRSEASALAQYLRFIIEVRNPGLRPMSADLSPRFIDSKWHKSPGASVANPFTSATARQGIERHRQYRVATFDSTSITKSNAVDNKEKLEPGPTTTIIRYGRADSKPGRCLKLGC